ncbi:hypothetical protein T484DRAFT_1859128 [Baffinella frigidus]|nr:hypothetical protein T484DRAFT_1859128 [Cryptophyta sp. CCMP2293]
MAMARRPGEAARFNLLMLDTGETYLSDIAVYHAPSLPAPHHPVPRVHGRLRICSSSLLFEPGPPDLPLLKIYLKHVTSIEPLVGKRALSGAGESFRVQCSSLTTLREQHNTSVP